MCQQCCIEFVSTQRGTVAYHDQLPPGSRERDVHPPGIGQETNFAVAVGSYAGNQDGFFLTSLETIDGINFQLLSIPLFA